MDQDRLISTLQNKVNSIGQEILKEAQREHDAIIADTNTSVMAMEQEVHDRVKARSEQILDRKYNAVRFRANVHRYEMKSKAIEDVWREAAAIIQGIAESPEYPAILEQLYRECASESPDGAVLRVSAVDASSVREFVKKSNRNFVVTEANDIRWGVEMQWPNGDVALVNTLEQRLIRLRGGGNTAISAILFGDGQE